MVRFGSCMYRQKCIVVDFDAQQIYVYFKRQYVNHCFTASVDSTEN